MWIFKDYLSCDCAVFDSQEAAEKFQRELNLRFVQKGFDTMTPDDYEITEIKLNPGVDEWFNEMSIELIALSKDQREFRERIEELNEIGGD